MRAADEAALAAAITALSDDIQRDRWYADPVAWAHDVLGVHLWSKQREIAACVAGPERHVAVQSAAGIGKTYLAAILALWFGCTRPTGKTKIMTTAPTADQVGLLLWGEIRKQHDAANLPGKVLLNNRWTTDDGRYVTGYGRKPPDHSGSAFQGEHEEHMLIIVDEAGGIPAKMWADIIAQSTGEDVTVLAIGNPDDSSSTFHDMCTRADAGWHVIKVSCFDTPNFTDETVPDAVAKVLPSRAYVEDARAAWGDTNPYYKAKVLGEWAESEEGLIPLGWITQAVRRWQTWAGDPSSERAIELTSGRTIFGVDVARFGADRTVFATRKGSVVQALEDHAGKDNVEVADLVEAKLTASPQSLAIVDSDGLGAGVVDILRHRGWSVVAFAGGEGTKRRDSSGGLRFAQVRSAAWYHVRELLNPALGSSICLPDHPRLQAELASPRWPEAVINNVVQVERKDHIRKRLGRSTDFADAVVMSFWTSSPPEKEDERHIAPGHKTAHEYEEAPTFDRPSGWSGGFNWN